jgi:hypothetical protein
LHFPKKVQAAGATSLSQLGGGANLLLRLLRLRAFSAAAAAAVFLLMHAHKILSAQQTNFLKNLAYSAREGGTKNERCRVRHLGIGVTHHRRNETQKLVALYHSKKTWQRYLENHALPSAICDSDLCD